jgi:hypothetical protein
VFYSASSIRPVLYRWRDEMADLIEEANAK